MRIESSNIAFQSAHASSRRVHERVELRIQRPAPAVHAPPDTVTLSERAVEAAAQAGVEEKADGPPATSLIGMIVERLLGGRRLHVTHPRAQEQRNEVADAAQAATAARRAEGASAELRLERSRVESEALAVSAQGVVRTRDGREIRFELSLALAQVHASSETLEISVGEPARQKKDPLVINFDGTAAQLSGERIAFDLDADGTTEDMPFVAAGSGLLVLDRDGDGAVTDGRELFGARSGDGFAELAALDGDGNQWIDEDDAAYPHLQVWTREGGRDRLQGLQDAGVGAIYLGSVASAFAYRDGEAQPVADLKTTGIWLAEDGGAGTVQQLDFYV